MPKITDPKIVKTVGELRDLGLQVHKKMGLIWRQEAAINILLTYINNPFVTQTVFNLGNKWISNDLLRSIGEPTKDLIE